MFEYLELSDGSSALKVFDEPSKEVVCELRKHQFDHLYVESGNWDDFSFVSENVNIKSFNCFRHLDTNDFSGIYVLKKLEKLALHSESRCNLSFGCFEYLKEVEIFWQKNYSDDLFECPRLEELFLSGYKGKEITPIKKAKKLKKLTIVYCAFECLKGIGEMSNLKDLSLNNFRKLMSLDGIEECHSLEELEITASNKITDFSALAKTPALKILDIDLKQIDSLKFLEGHPTLECLAIAGTKVIDGDMSVLKTIPNLKDIRFANKRHYSHKNEDLCTELGLPIPCE